MCTYNVIVNFSVVGSFWGMVDLILHLHIRPQLLTRQALILAEVAVMLTLLLADHFGVEQYVIRTVYAHKITLTFIS